MELKHYNQQCIVQWSNSKNHSQLLACGLLNPDQHDLFNINIVSLDISQKGKNANVVGNAFYNVPFRCLAWDNFGQKQNNYPNGIIFGGMQDGSYTLWNAYQMLNFTKHNIRKSIQNIQNQPAFLYGQQGEEGAYPIMCAQWNALKNNYLAFGSTQLILVDIGKDISNPILTKPGSRNPHQGSYVTSVSWNKQVPNILASASQNGLIALWNITQNKSIFQFKDSPISSGNRNVSICWSKTISTQIAVTLDDQKRNQLQIWDLRNQKGPVAVFDRGHTKGINTMNWCQTDPELILTGGRDKKIVCWNYTQDEGPLSQTQLQSDIFDIKWSKKLPSIYSVCLENRTSIFTLNDTNLFSYVPKWYKVPVSSTFLNNQSLLTFSQSNGNVLQQQKLAGISIQNKSQLQNSLKQLQSIISRNSQIKQNSNEELWKLVTSKSGNNGDADIYNYLGFNKEKIIKQVEKYTGKKRQNPLNAAKKTQNQPQSKIKSKAYTPVIGQQAASFFATIGQTNFSQTIKSNEQQQGDSQNVKYDMVPRNFNWNIGKQRLIKQNILIGNYQGAIDAAIKCGRTAEALIIAYSVDQNTFNSTLKTFFTQTTDSFITDVLKNITYRDTQQLVRKYDVSQWKECVSLIFSISSVQKRLNLLNLLADRLIQQNQALNNQESIISANDPAILCYILAEDFNKIASIYYQNLNKLEGGSNERKLVAVQYAQRLISIYHVLTVNVQPSKLFEKLMRQIAFIAIQQNQKMLAYVIFTTFAQPSSSKYIDFLIHNTKGLQQYKASNIFKPINIPVMLKKKEKDVQIQKGKKNTNQNLPPNFNSGLNQNQPKDVQKHKPIFVQKEQDSQKNIPKPPPPRKQKQFCQQTTQNYDNQSSQSMHNPPQNVNKKKIPPPPPGSFSTKSNIQQQNTQVKNTNVPPPPSSSHSFSNNQYTKQQPLVETEKKNPPPPPPSGRKNPPPIQSSFNEQPTYQTPIRKQTNQTVSKTQQKKNIPPPPRGNVKKITDHSNYEQDEEQTDQNFYKDQNKNNKSQILPPSYNRQIKQRTSNNNSFNSGNNSSQVYSQTNHLNAPTGNIKKIPPPPPSNMHKKQSNQESYQNEKSQTNIKPTNMKTINVPPRNKPQTNQNYYKQQEEQQPIYNQSKNNMTENRTNQNNRLTDQNTEKQQVVIKRLPPPVAQKKGPPPPPRR